MRLLLDTHIVIWAALDPDALSAAERRWMAEADTPLVLLAVAVAVWELRRKWHSFHISGGRKGAVNPAAVVAFAARMGMGVLAADRPSRRCRTCASA